MGNRRDCHDDFAVHLMSRQHDGAGAVLHSLVAARVILGRPKIRVTYDKTWARIGERHSSGLDFMIERRTLLRNFQFRERS